MLNQRKVKEIAAEQIQAVNQLNHNIALIKTIPELDLLKTRCLATDFHTKKHMIGAKILETDLKTWESLTLPQQCSDIQAYQNLFNELVQILIKHHSIDIGNGMESCSVLSWAARTSNAPLMKLLLDAGATMTGGIECNVMSGLMASKTEPADPMLAVLWNHKQNQTQLLQAGNKVLDKNNTLSM